MVSARSFLVAFKYSSTVAYVVEFSHHKIRLYAERKLATSTVEESTITYQRPPFKLMGNGAVTVVKGDTLSGGGGNTTVEPSSQVIEIDSPYGLNDLWDYDEKCCKIQTIQHSDVLYIFNEKFPIMVLKRYSNTNWQLEKLELKNGPFMNMNTEDISITASDVSGEVTLESDVALFTSDDEGRLLRLRMSYNDEIIPWTADKEFGANDICFSDNKYYQTKAGGTTGVVKPVHSEGKKSDGGVCWEYLHDGMGLVRIHTFVSDKKVKATVLRRLPDEVKSGTVYWEMGLLYKGSLYPKSGAFFRNRFAFLVNTKNGPNVCLSVNGDYNNFADLECGEATAETAITVPVLNTVFNEGKWLYAGNVLFVGTDSSEFYIDVVSTNSALASDNVKIQQISQVGSKSIIPIGVGAHVFFVDRYGLSLRDLMYNYYNDGYDQTDVSLLGKHLFQSNIVALVYQETPYKVLWCVMGDGSVSALTFSAEQEVSALSRHDFNGVVESIAVIPNREECFDEVWLEIKRTIEGVTVRSVECLETGLPQNLPANVYQANSVGLKQLNENKYMLEMASYLDASILYLRNSDEATGVIDGLDHLEGEEVMIFADGVVLAPQVVRDGKIRVPATCARVLAGLPIKSQYIPQNIYINQENGVGVGQKQRINHVLLMLYLSGGGKIGENEETLQEIYYRRTDAVMNKPQELFSGNKEILFNGSTSNQEQGASLLIENDSPLPMNILAIVPYIDVSE